MRKIIRSMCAIAFGLVMLVVYFLPFGQSLESNYGLRLLYAVRGDLPAPPEALVIGLDNRSVRWLNRNIRKLDQAAPELDACLPDFARQSLEGAANINHVPRSVHACLLDRLVPLEPRLVVFDINFNKPRPDDEVFAEAVARSGNVLLFERFSDDATGIERLHPVGALKNAALDTMAFNVNSARGEIATGYLTRHGPFRDLLPMPDKAWTLYTGDALPEARPDVQPFWMYGPPTTVQTIPLMSVFDSGGAALPDDLKNRVIFVGSSDPEDASIDDHFPVPTSGDRLIGGVELAATAFLNRLYGTQLQRPDPAIEALVVFLVATIGAMVILSFAGWTMMSTLAALSVGWLVISIVAFIQAQLWLPVAVPVFLTAAILTLAAISVRYLFVRALVARLAPKQIARSLIGGTVADRRGVKTEPATIMFTDLVGSTGLAETLDEIEYSYAVNRYYDAATEVIEDHGGMVVEFMGDGILSLFSETVTGKDHAARCCRAAEALLAKVAEDNVAAGPDAPMLSLRIGINTGVTATGDIGARTRYNFKALGDVVNVAARLESMGKTIVDRGENVVLLSGTTRDAADLAAPAHPGLEPDVDAPV